MEVDHTAAFDAYFYPGTRTLINLPGFRDPDVLRAFEYERASIRAAELVFGARSTPRTFDLPHLQAIHWTLLREVYAWAGRPRTCNIQKDTVAFADLDAIDPLMDQAAEVARAGPARHDDPHAVAQWIAAVYVPTNYAHPFREGNGRSTRMLLHQLLEGTEYTLNLSEITPVRWNWLAEVETRCYALNGEPLGHLADELAVSLVLRAEAHDPAHAALAETAARYLAEIHHEDPQALPSPTAVLAPREYDQVTSSWAKTVAATHPEALTDPHWPALARQLDRMQQAGTDIAQLLTDSAHRPLNTSRPARDLDLRISAAAPATSRRSPERPIPAGPGQPMAMSRQNIPRQRI